jgi:cysteinyl-tRNA synthetase
MDLKFPHHENEIAQSCAACGTPFVNVWMHNGFVRIDDEKMSKSTGNFFTVRDVLKTLRDPEVLRFFLLSSHYRGPINYSAAQLAQADETLLGLYRALKGVDVPGASSVGDFEVAMADFHAAMDDDFNTPEAFAVMQGVARDLNSAKAGGDTVRAAAAAAALLAMGGMLGFLQQNPDRYLKRGAAPVMPQDSLGRLTDGEIEELLSARRAARAAKKFAESDRIRDRLSAAGIVLEDKPGGLTEWRRA